MVTSGLLVGARRRAAVQASWQHQRAGVPANADSCRRALLNQLFRLGHTGDVEGWLPAADMPAHFRPEHLGRAPARFEEAQLLHWQKETLQRMSAAEIGAWLGLRRSGRNSSSWCATTWCCPRTRRRGSAVVRGDLPPLGADEARDHRRGGPGILRRRRGRRSTSRARTSSALVKTLEGAHRAQGRRPVHAAAGRAHRPEPRAGTRAATQTHATGDGAPPAGIPCSEIHNSLTGRKEAPFKPLRPARCACTSAASPSTTTSRRPCAHADGVRPGAALPARAAASSHLRAQHHRHRRQDHPARGRERRGLGRARAPLHRWRCTRTAPRSVWQPPDHRAARHRVHRRRSSP